MRDRPTFRVSTCQARLRARSSEHTSHRLPQYYDENWLHPASILSVRTRASTPQSGYKNRRVSGHVGWSAETVHRVWPTAWCNPCVHSLDAQPSASLAVAVCRGRKPLVAEQGSIQQDQPPGNGSQNQGPHDRRRTQVLGPPSQGMVLAADPVDYRLQGRIEQFHD